MRYTKILFGILIACAVALVAFNDSPKMSGMQSEFAAPSASTYYLYPTSATGYESVTITNSGNDTTTLGANLLSRWSYCWHINSTQSSGTENVIAIIQETNNASSSQTTPTDWIEVDRDTLTANEDLRMTGDIVYGVKQRLILDGSGTQSTAITTKFVGKKF